MRLKGYIITVRQNKGEIVKKNKYKVFFPLGETSTVRAFCEDEAIIRTGKYGVLLVLKKQCKKAGSQKNYAKKIGVSEQYLSEIIRGTRPLSDNFLERIGFEKVVFCKEKHPKGKK